MAKQLSKAITDQITKDLNRDLNRFITVLTGQLPNYSPQYTGFFASSWKASTSRPRPVDKVEDFSPWNQIKRDKRNDPGVPARVQPRFDVPTFGFQDRIYIGNTSVYARYALASPSNQIQNFIQGEVQYLIQFIFGDQRPDIRVASQPLGGSGDSLSNIRGSKYTAL